MGTALRRVPEAGLREDPLRIVGDDDVGWCRHRETGEVIERHGMRVTHLRRWFGVEILVWQRVDVLLNAWDRVALTRHSWPKYLWVRWRNRSRLPEARLL